MSKREMDTKWLLIAAQLRKEYRAGYPMKKLREELYNLGQLQMQMYLKYQAREKLLTDSYEDGIDSPSLAFIIDDDRIIKNCCSAARIISDIACGLSAAIQGELAYRAEQRAQKRAINATH